MKLVEVEQKSLYERLGETKGIESLVEDVVEAHMNNPVIKARFLPYKEKGEQLKQIKRHVVDFFVAGSGGPAVYTGRDMPMTHRGMNINEAEYMATIDDILKVLREHGIDDDTRKDVLAILYSLKEQIIGQ
jgi:hemoglobin